MDPLRLSSLPAPPPSGVEAVEDEDEDEDVASEEDATDTSRDSAEPLSAAAEEVQGGPSRCWKNPLLLFGEEDVEDDDEAMAAIER